MESKMYESYEDLPDEMRNGLSREACELYIAAYNRILEKESGPGNPHGKSIHQVADEGALLAVKNQFELDENGDWRRAPIGNDMKELGPAAEDEPTR